jgi:hypothetical protein
MSLDTLVELTDVALAFARQQHVDKLLVDTRATFGFDSPDLASRFWFVSKWADTADGIRLAVVARPEMIDSEKFGVTVARNRGLVANIFESEPEATAWLDSGRN